MSKLVLPPKLVDISTAITCIACVLQKPIAEVIAACNIADIDLNKISKSDLQEIFMILGYHTIAYEENMLIEGRMYMIVVADLNIKGYLKWIIADYLTVVGEIHYLDPVLEDDISYNSENPPKMYTSVVEILIEYNYFLGDNND